MSGSEQIKKTGLLSGARRVETPTATSLGAVDQVSPAVASEPVSASTPLEASDPLQRLTALDIQNLTQVAQLIKEVDQGERDAQAAWDELLRLALMSSLNVPSPIVERLLPRLKELLAHDSEAAEALRARLGLPRS